MFCALCHFHPAECKCGSTPASAERRCTPLGVDFSQPLDPEDYQGIIKEGFATNYFKTQYNKTENKPIAFKYRTQNIQDICDKGFRNVRLRCRPELFDDMYDTDEFATFKTKLTEVVDECISVGIAPIISWEHHLAEAYATETDLANFIEWWTIVAEMLRDRNYHLSFNIFTELGIDICKTKEACVGSLRRNKTKYDQWSSEVVSAIRATGGKNADRIIILGSPEKTSVGLEYIFPNKTYVDSYTMVEWHEYAAGPSEGIDKPRYWSGNGSEAQTKLLRDGVERAHNYTFDTGIPTYFGAWMPRDNKDGGLDQEEVINFARFFVDLFKKAEIPWSLNVLDNYYNSKRCEWITDIQNLKGAMLNMSSVLDTMEEVLFN